MAIWGSGGEGGERREKGEREGKSQFFFSTSSFYCLVPFEMENEQPLFQGVLPLSLISNPSRGAHRLPLSLSHLLEDVVDERVEDRHGLGRDAGVGVHLLQDLVDVDLVRLVLGLDALLGAALGDLLGGLLSGSFGSHCGKVLGLGGWGVCRKVG